jgi:hypothetical protein
MDEARSTALRGDWERAVTVLGRSGGPGPILTLALPPSLVVGRPQTLASTAIAADRRVARRHHST